jgi:DNA-binding PadR family transcriptional regulator
MKAAGWLTSEWGESDAQRRAKYYRLTASGRRQLKEESNEWSRIAVAIAHALGTA